MNCVLIVKQRRDRTTIDWEYYRSCFGSTVWDGGAQYTNFFAKRKDFVWVT